ncbi:MAG: AGE family epimerase/isomerase [Armatimonadota bacterium]|jgi:N-acylglucosamine 2-epimerase
MTERMSFAGLLEFYENHLRGQVMPFWTTHCIDWEHGGISNCVADDGAMHSTDKYVWSQGRALWTFSALYSDFDQDPQWLGIADNVAGFLMRHGRDHDGAWAFCLDADGSVAEPPKSVYVDAFVMYGLTEYARATGNPEAIEIAEQTFRRTSPMLRDHTTLPTEPLPIPDGLQSHGPSMIFALVYHDLGVLTRNEEIINRALELAEIIMTQHLKPEHRLLYELVRPGGELADGDPGKTFVPGHVIESMWFMERIYRHHDRRDRVAEAMDAIRWHLEKGWDEEYGGILLACHTEGGTPLWNQPDAKCWWPHTEALYALLRAHAVTGESWCMDWYWRVHDYTFAAFPNREHGDWHQNLDRRGNPIPVVLGLTVKDPFHLPRALIYSIATLRNLAAERCSSSAT